MQTLADLNKQDGTTVLVSLHQVDVALRFCPRTVALSRGRVVYDGPSSELTIPMLRDLYGAEAEELLSPVQQQVSSDMAIQEISLPTLAAAA